MLEKLEKVVEKLDESLECPAEKDEKMLDDLMADLKDEEYNKLEEGVKNLYAIIILSVVIAITSFYLSYYLFPILVIDLLWSLLIDTNKTLSRNVKITKALSYLLLAIAATITVTAFTYSLPIIILIEVIALANLVAKRFIYAKNLNGSTNLNTSIQQSCYQKIRQEALDNWDHKKKFCIYFMMADPKSFMRNVNDIKIIQSNGYNVLPVFNDSDEINERKIACDTIKNKGDVEALKDKKVALLFIHSHGNQGSIDNLIVEDDTEADRNLVEPDCKIILQACETGKGGQKSIAAKIAKANPGCKVYASDENIRGVKIDQDDQVFFEGVNKYMRFESYNSFTFFCEKNDSEVIIEKNNPKSKGWKLF